MTWRLGMLNLAVGALALTAACSVGRRLEDGPRDCLSWRGEVRQLMVARCVECHSGTQPAGKYDLSSYDGVLGPGTHQTPNAKAGDANSVLLARIWPAWADENHANQGDAHTALRRWVVDCRLEYVESAIHGPGIVNPEDEQFHGKFLADHNWDFPMCQECHGEDFKGGKAGESCLQCHTQGPTACNTCHADKPTSGAHTLHLVGGPLGKGFDCSACHIKPARWDDPGHIRDADGHRDDGSAEVTFGDLPRRDYRPDRRLGPPTWNPETRACSNIYCHGDVFGDAAATAPSFRWEAPASVETRCTRCHGLPPADHAVADCTLCHGLVVGPDQAFRETARHVDGQVDLGDGRGNCGACHGAAGEATAFRDLHGNTGSQSLAAGAHDSHVRGLHRVTAPIACKECHVDVRQVNDPGHVDHPLPAVVFPPQAGSGSVARAGGAQPSFDRTSATCSSVWCHAGGNHVADATPTILRSPQWTAVGQQQGVCGSCHGAPPQDANHDGTMKLSGCRTCHPQTVDEYGNIVITQTPDGGATSTHINGAVDGP